MTTTQRSPARRSAQADATTVPQAQGRVLSGADIVLESLTHAGATTVFGYPGGVVLPLYDRLPAHPKVRHILVRHEQGGGHAADGYARATGELGVALATSGPGATNLVTAVQNAMMDSVPVLFITGNVARNMIGRDGFQEADATGILMPAVKHNYLVMRAQDLAPTFAEAIYIATTGRPGPVHIDIPKDVFLEEAEFRWPERVRVRGYEVPGAAAEEEIRAAAERIDASKRPIIFAGHGIVIANASEELRAFAERTGIPVLTTLLGLGVLDQRHALSYGMMGMHGSYHANMAASNADLIIGLGMRMDDRALGRFADLNPTATVIHVDIDPAEHNKNIDTAVPITGDVKDVLPQLTAAVKRSSQPEWVRWIDDLARAHAASLAVPEGPELTVQFVVQRIARAHANDEDAIIVTGVGQHQMWAAQHMSISRPRQLITSGGLGTMGFALPAAVGAKLARPDAEVWVVAGDGGFQMTMAELATIAQEKIKINVAVINNGYLGMVRQWQEFFYERRYAATPLFSPDFAKLAECFGLRGETVRTRRDVEPAVERARNDERTVVIDFHVEQEDTVYPMVPAGADLHDMIRRPSPAPIVETGRDA